MEHLMQIWTIFKTEIVPVLIAASTAILPIIYTILKGLIDTLPESLPIYCEAWRINQNQYPNMISTINKLNMQLLERDVDMTLSKKHLNCSECPYRVYTENPEDNCNCYSDIYILNRASQEND